MIMTAAKTQDAESEDSIRRAYNLDKIAISIIGLLLTFLVGTLWTMKNEISQLEITMAENRSELGQLTRNMAVLMYQGSRKAQLLEVVVENLAKRFERFDQFMSAGPRFTLEDGDELKRRIERLEAQKK